MDIIGRFVQIERREVVVGGKKHTPDVTIFPRYHQWDCVRRLEDGARSEGPGHSYLRQLQDTIYQFEHVHGVVRKIDESSAQLADALATESRA